MIWPTWVLSQLWPFKITTKASPSRWRAILFAVVGILVDSHLVVVEPKWSEVAGVLARDSERLMKLGTQLF